MVSMRMTDLSKIRNRQSKRRIDFYEIIVMERSMTIKFAGYCGDIHRTETPGTTTGMGGGNSGLQEQWFICPAVVQ